MRGEMITAPKGEERGLEKAGHGGKSPQRKGSDPHFAGYRHCKLLVDWVRLDSTLVNHSGPQFHYL